MTETESSSQVQTEVKRTPGAGVDHEKVVDPTKRLKKAYRERDRRRTTLSLKEFAAFLANEDDSKLQHHALTWLSNKDDKRTEARKGRKERIRAKQAESRKNAGISPGKRPKKPKARRKIEEDDDD
jgi:hypothetical protein